MGFEYLCGGDSTTSLGSLLHCLITLMGKKNLMFQLNSLYFNLCSLSCTSAGYNQEDTVQRFYSHPFFSHPQLHMEMLPLLSLLFSRLNTPSLLRLSSRETCSLIIFGLCHTFQEHPCPCCLGALRKTVYAGELITLGKGNRGNCAGNLLELPVPALLLPCGRDNNPAA